MKRYENHTPRLAFAIAAVVMSLATMIAFVGVPAAVDGSVATTLARAGAPTRVTNVPARIDVIATRDVSISVADATPAATRH